MAAVRGCTIRLLLCALLLATALMAADESDDAATRARGQGRTPNGKRRQVKGNIQSVVTGPHSNKLFGDTLFVFILWNGDKNTHSIMQWIRHQRTPQALQLSTLSYTICRLLDRMKLNEISCSTHVLQVTKDPNGVLSIVQTVRQRRPGPGIKPGQDKTILNETLGSKTVKRDGRCEYRRKQMSIMRQQQSFHGEWPPKYNP
jgi:hypothetical protein